MVCSCAMSSNSVWLQIMFCSCVNETTRDTFLRENGRSLRFPKIFFKKQTWWSNDKTIIELGYHKISWFASVSHINYLPQPSASANNWSARHWQITIFCSTSSNTCQFLVYRRFARKYGQECKTSTSGWRVSRKTCNPSFPIANVHLKSVIYYYVC